MQKFEDWGNSGLRSILWQFDTNIKNTLFLRAKLSFSHYCQHQNCLSDTVTHQNKTFHFNETKVILQMNINTPDTFQQATHAPQKKPNLTLSKKTCPCQWQSSGNIAQLFTFSAIQDLAHTKDQSTKHTLSIPGAMGSYLISKPLVNLMNTPCSFLR